jgi:hypothetical protein
MRGREQHCDAALHSLLCLWAFVGVCVCACVCACVRVWVGVGVGADWLCCDGRTLLVAVVRLYWAVLW